MTGFYMRATLALVGKLYLLFIKRFKKINGFRYVSTKEIYHMRKHNLLAKKSSYRRIRDK